jgi:hypothetical protein
MAIALTLSVLVCIGLLFQIWLTYLIAGILPNFGGNFVGTPYWFTIPHRVLLPLTLAAVVIHAKFRTKTALVIAIVCLSGLLPTSFFPFADNLWPGGDDGPGLAWLFFLGGASLLNIVIGVPMLLLADRFYPKAPNRRRQRKVRRGH